MGEQTHLPVTAAPRADVEALSRALAFWGEHRNPRQIARKVEDGRSESDRAYGDRPYGADTPEAQVAVVLATMGRVITATAATLPVEHIGHELAAQLIAIGEPHVTAMTAWLARLRQRVVTRGHVAAKGGAA